MTRTTRAVATAAAALLGVVGLAPAALAHVTVAPADAEKGGFAKLAFRVPNERDGAGTTTVEINFPSEHPLAFVNVRPHQGWSYTVDRATLDTPVEAFGEEVTDVVSKVTFTGGPIRPGEFDEFELSVGPLPEDVDQLVFPVLQTYEGGEVVRWIEPTPASGEEPEHPAPVLRLTAAGADATTDAPATAEEGGGDVASTDDVDTARTVAVAALVVGALGLVAGAAALLRKRSG